MTRWNLSAPVLRQASDELAFLLQQRRVAASVKQALQTLTQQEDPRRPRPDSNLIVDPLNIHAPGWFRLKLEEEDIRIAFRLLVVRDEMLIEIDAIEYPLADEGFIDATYANFRQPDTYQEIRRRWRYLKGR